MTMTKNDLKKISEILYALGCIIIFGYSCKKPCLQNGVSHSFAITVNMNPGTDSIKIGDTIYLNSITSTTLIDVNTGQSINYNGADNLGTTLSFSELIPGVDTGKGAVADFQYFSINGKIYNDPAIPNPTSFQQLKYQESNSSYILKVGIIAQKKGVYGVGIGDGLNVTRKGSCDKAGFLISYANTNQHFYLHDQIYPSQPLDNYGRLHEFYFKVY